VSGRRTLGAGLAVSALIIAMTAPSSASAAYFRTPSGNIVCGTGPQSFDGGASRTVLSEGNARGEKIWSMRRRGRVRVFRSMSNAPVEVRVLRYGRIYRGFGIRCASRNGGLSAGTVRATGSSCRVSASGCSDWPVTGPYSLLAVVAALALAPAAAAPPPAMTAADRDCADFDNQRQAQNYFIDRGVP
jgi:hypothetical protein